MPPPIELDNIQALVWTGLSRLQAVDYLLLQVQDPALARAGLRAWLADEHVHSVQALRRARSTDRHVAVAVSHAGLLALGHEPEPQRAFPSAFARDMRSRWQLFGDQLARWSWGADDSTHLWVADFRRLGQPPLAVPAGLHELARVPGDPAAFAQRPGQLPGTLTEAFGFADGIGNPIPEGLPLSQRQRQQARQLGERFRGRLLPLGELLLGQPNSYNELSYAPQLRGWSGPGFFADDGSYLVVRQIRQFPQKLHDWERAQGPLNPTAAELLMGRLRTGEPLVPASEPDDFGYRLQDPLGLHCPRGAHIRRANPRDDLGPDTARGLRLSQAHRLLRRSRPYRLDAENLGLMFVALNADLERQYEVVQGRWLLGSRFGGLRGDAEITDHRPDAPQEFGLPGLPRGRRLCGLQAFTEVCGGGYFLLPSLRALRFLAQD